MNYVFLIVNIHQKKTWDITCVNLVKQHLFILFIFGQHIPDLYVMYRPKTPTVGKGIKTDAPTIYSFCRQLWKKIRSLIQNSEYQYRLSFNIFSLWSDGVHELFLKRNVTCLRKKKIQKGKYVYLQQESKHFSVKLKNSVIVTDLLQVFKSYVRWPTGANRFI